MPPSRRGTLVALALVLTACGREAGRPLSHRGFEPGMPDARFRETAGRVGTLQCGPFQVAGVGATTLCATSSAATGIRVVGTLGAPDSTVPYVVVQEPDSTGVAFAGLTRAWGAPDTLVATGRRWRRGRWIADADTAGGRLTIWLTDTATQARIAEHTLAAARARLETMPVRNEVAAVLDTIRRMSPAGAALPATPDEVSPPPRVIACRQVDPPADLAGVAGSVRLMYVVDSAGRAEPGSVHILEATRPGFMAPAVATIGSCSFRPGRQRGRAVRVLVQQRVDFRGEAGSPGG
jgi:hypothetical protein